MKVEVDVLLPVPNSLYGLCGHKATFEEVEEGSLLELRCCEGVKVTVLGSRPYWWLWT